MAKIAENAINSALSCLYALMTKMAVFILGIRNKLSLLQ
jgi:hypothetical protein